MLRSAQRALSLARLSSSPLRAARPTSRRYSARAAASSASPDASPTTGSSSNRSSFGSTTSAGPASTSASARQSQPASERMSIFDISDLYDTEPPSIARNTPAPLESATPSAAAAASVASVYLPQASSESDNLGSGIFDTSDLYDPEPSAALVETREPERVVYHFAFASDRCPVKVSVTKPVSGRELSFRFVPRRAKTIAATSKDAFCAPARWVRDSDISARSIDSHTRQKVHSSGSIDWAKDLRLRSSGEPVKLLLPVVDARVSEMALEFFWESPPGEDEYSSIIPVSLVSNPHHGSTGLLPAPYHWSLKEFSRQDVGRDGSTPEPPKKVTFTYDTFNQIGGLHAALRALRQWGIIFLKDVSTEATDDAGCELRRVAKRIGGLRNTFYGETWDVKALGSQGRNVAYTNVDLGLHMDLLYFENPPQIQLLHCLRNRVISGGDSYFVDSFKAADRLRRKNPKAWKLLTRAPVPYHYKNETYHYEFSHPVIELMPAALGASAEVRHINWSPPFQAALPPYQSGILLDAMAAFEKELRAPNLEFKMRMNEGDLVIFDNRRVLHARTAFVEPEAPPAKKGEKVEPSRWLKGGYVDGDASWDILRTLAGLDPEDRHRVTPRLE